MVFVEAGANHKTLDKNYITEKWLPFIKVDYCVIIKINIMSYKRANLPDILRKSEVSFAGQEVWWDSYDVRRRSE